LYEFHNANGKSIAKFIVEHWKYPHCHCSCRHYLIKSDWTAAIVQKTRDKYPPMDALRYFLQHSLKHGEGSKAGFGCMAVNTVIELAGVDDELAAAASAWLTKLQMMFEECLCEAGYSPARAAEYAAYLMLVNEGVRVASRRKLSRRQSLEAIDTALRLLQTAPR
jgi:TetR/AcrR family transcriptional repressor of nem operon